MGAGMARPPPPPKPHTLRPALPPPPSLPSLPPTRYQVGDVLAVTLTRPLAATDAWDRAWPLDGSAPPVWAVGPVSEGSNASQPVVLYHRLQVCGGRRAGCACMWVAAQSTASLPPLLPTLLAPAACCRHRCRSAPCSHAACALTPPCPLPLPLLCPALRSCLEATQRIRCTPPLERATASTSPPPRRRPPAPRCWPPHAAQAPRLPPGLRQRAPLLPVVQWRP